MEVLDASGKLNYFNGTSASPMVTEAHAATLTNKVLSGASNTFTNISYSSLILSNSIVNADINASAAIAYSKLNLVGSIVNADIHVSAAIARTKLASGTNYRILANSSSGVMSENAALTAAHVLFADANGQLSGEQFLSKARGGSAQDNSSITFPASGSLVTEAGTQTLSNKTFSDPVTLAEIATPATPSSGNGKIYFKSDGFLYQLNDDGTETKVGAGSGGINYISNNPDFESSTAGWATYADAAGSAPVDGTGGTANITLTRSTSAPLRGTASGLITKDASNRQGQGVSFDFTLSNADKAKPLAVTFDYSVDSGFVAGDSSDIRVYVYDTTTPEMIQVAPYTIQGASGSNHRFIGTFQTTSASTSYRVILHIATTNATAWTFKFDNVQLGPQQINYGSPVTDWYSYVPTVTGVTSNPTKSNSPTTDIAYARRSGDSLEIEYTFVASTTSGSAAGSGSYIFGLPSGLSIDTSKVTANASQNIGVVGSAMVGTSTQNLWGSVKVHSSVGVGIEVGDETSGKGRVGSTTYPFTTSSLIYSFRAVVPILGWSSTVEMSNDTDTRVVAARYFTTVTQTLPTGTIINFVSKDYDTHGAVTTGVGTWKFTAPVPGYYTVSYMAEMQSIAASAGQFTTGRLYKNNGPVQYIGLDYADATNTIPRVNTGTAGIYLNAGDYIDIRLEETLGTDPTLNGNNQTNWIDIKRTSGPSAIAASETIACRYTSATGQSFDNNVTTNFIPTTKDYDTHGAFNTSTGVFTVPAPGLYEVQGIARFTNTFGGGTRIICDVNLTSAIKSRAVYQIVASHPSPSAYWIDTVKCIAGDTLSVSINQDSASPGTLRSDNSECFVSIKRIG